MRSRPRPDLRDERGAIIVLTALTLPVLLLLTALIVDAGNWYTHKRQLQNRADAAALAAGVEYGRLWTACVGTDPAVKLAAAQAIERAARRYAGDPTVRPAISYDPTSPAAVNTEIASQARLDVMVNSTDYTAGTDYSDGSSPYSITLGGPCFDHPANAATENEANISPLGGYWVDVKVRENNLPSLFGSLGLDLFRVVARARVWVGKAVSENRFVPLAVAESEIKQAQIRYYNLCDPASPVLMYKADLTKLDAAYQTGGGTDYWGPTAIPSGTTLNLPTSASCPGADYIPVATEVRVAGPDASVIDIDTPTCAQLLAARYGDCFSRVSTIRVWKDGAAQPPSNQAWIKGFALTAGGTCSPDGLFARDDGSGTCTYPVSVDVDFQTLAGGNRGGNTTSNFTVEVRPVGGSWTSLAGPGSMAPGVLPWTGTLTNATPGRTELEVKWSWTDTDPTHTAPGGGQCKNGNNNPCRASGGAYNFTSVFLADDANAGVVDLVRTSGVGQSSGLQLGPPLASAQAGTTMTIYPTVGLQSSLHAGVHRVLRASGPQGNGSLDCDPAVGGQGHDFVMFQTGCPPYYGGNPFTNGFWWNTATKECPVRVSMIAQPNSPSQPWKCVVSAPGFSPNVMADGIAARTGNCTNIQNNSCAKTQCLVPNDYIGWAAGTSTYGLGFESKRIIKLFIVPYGALKGVQANDTIPILRFAAFYVTGWGAQGAGNQDPCTADPPGTPEPDEPAQAGEIKGYFVDFVAPGGGDPVTMKCETGSADPCHAVLVR